MYISAALLPPEIPRSLGVPAVAEIDCPSEALSLTIRLCAVILVNSSESHLHFSTVICPTSRNVSAKAGSETAGKPPTITGLVSPDGKAELAYAVPTVISEISTNPIGVVPRSRRNVLNSLALNIGESVGAL